MAVIALSFDGPEPIDLLVDTKARVSLRPGRLEPAAARGVAALPEAGRPLVRRRRRRQHLLAAFVGSGGVHLLVLALLLLVVRPTGPPRTQEPPSVEMVFGHNGSAGLQGTSVPKAEQGAEPPPQAAPAPEPLQAVPAPAPMPAPAPPPAPVVPQTREAATPRPHPHREVRRQARSSNPFANLTNLSLAPTDTAPTPNFSRRGRGGSGSAVSLSLGPMVQGGHLAMPFSMRGGHGMTSDYRGMLDDWVNAHKYYPQVAADRGHDGQVALHVVWNRDGRVLSVRVIYGSGDDDLDDAWVGLFRGTRLPPPPPDVPGDPIEYDMVMNYELLR